MIQSYSEDRMSLSIGISTVSYNKDNAIELAMSLIPSMKSGLVVEVFILSQIEDYVGEEEIYDGIFLCSTRDRGLSKSRNFLLDKLKGDYIWLLDDDVIVSKKEIISIHNKIHKNPECDFIIGDIYCSDKDSYYKRKSLRDGISGLLKTSSIEIVTRRNFLKDNNIRYCDSLGVGAKYPCGEENYFLLQSFNRGAKVKFFDEIFVFHPCNLTESRLDYFGNEAAIIPKVLLCYELPFYHSIKYALKVVGKLASKFRLKLIAYFLWSLFRHRFKAYI